MKIFVLLLILISVKTHAESLDCKGATLWRVLKEVEGVGRLHNCYVEVFTLEDANYLKAQIFVRDLYRCEDNPNNCKSLTLEYRMPKNCEIGSEKLGKVKYLRSFMGPQNIQVHKAMLAHYNFYEQLVELSFFEKNFSLPGDKTAIICRDNLMGGYDE